MPEARPPDALWIRGPGDARLEALNKEFGSQLLISSAVRDVLGEDCPDAISLGEVPIRGYERPMAIWQLE